MRPGVASRGALTALLLAAPVLADNPRLEVTELRLVGRDADALALLERLRDERPAAARPLGFEYAIGRLSEALGDLRAAEEAYARALGEPAALVPFARYRLALRQHAIGHPEVAAGLAATALKKDPPVSLREPLAELLVATLVEGGDCRLLAGIDRARFPERIRRRLELATARCTARSTDGEEPLPRFLSILASDTNDLTALDAARAVARLADPGTLREDDAARVGSAFHEHREFEAALPWLQRAATDRRRHRRAETLYVLARSHFWRGEYRLAAQVFEQASLEATAIGDRARAHYQRARSLELAGDWSAAAALFRQVHEVDPASGWAPAGLLSAMRLEWRRGNEEQGLRDLDLLRSRPAWREMLDRARLFLAASEIARGRTDRSADWLAAVAARDRDIRLQKTYWHGRLAEAEGDASAAVERFIEVLRLGHAHPLAVSARTRLAEPTLAAIAERQGLRLAASSDPGDLHAAWILLGDGHARGATSRRVLEQSHLRHREIAALNAARHLPPSTWRIWDTARPTPEELLLALGLWDEGAPAVASHFPLSDLSLGLTGLDLLTRGGHHREALRRAEVLARRLPGAVPVVFYPEALRRLLFPLPWGELLERETSRRGVPPLLLAGLIREESRFDPLAVSPVGARGLTQFVPDTARRMAPRAGVRVTRAEDLHDPHTAIALGAAYLAWLEERFWSQSLAVLAAYNAGEDQANLWRTYCFSTDPAEYFTKVGFPETRDYLVKVMTSWEQYEALYGGGSARLRLEADR